MFRGLRRNAEGAVVWPWVDVGIGLFTGGGRLKAAGISVGTWSSLHTATAGRVDTKRTLCASFSLSVSKAVVATTYTSYTSHYYELPEGDSTFGYSSVSVVVTTPLGGGDHRDLRGGVECQGLGTTARAFNSGDQNQVIGSVGIGFTH